MYILGRLKKFPINKDVLKRGNFQLFFEQMICLFQKNVENVMDLRNIFYNIICVCSTIKFHLSIFRDIFQNLQAKRLSFILIFEVFIRTFIETK